METPKSLIICILFVLIGTLTFVSYAQAQNTEAAIARAKSHIKKNADELGLTQRDVAKLAVADAYTDEHNGVTHVYLQQEHQNVPVYNALISVAVLSDGTVAHVSNRLLSGLADRIASAAPGMSAIGAAQAAAQHLGLNPSGLLRILEQEPGARRRATISPAGIASDPIKAELIFQPTEGGEVRLAWQVGIDQLSEPHYWQVRVDAVTGEALDQDDLVDHDTWSVSASTSAVDGDGPVAPATGRSVVREGAFSEGALGMGSALSPDAYRVFPFPFESPQHGATHDLVTNPINNAPSGTYPGAVGTWHDTDGDGSADFTDTRGNNVDAYADRDGDDAPDAGSRPDGGASLTFDIAIDLTDEPADYTDAAVVNLFYWSNIVHDVIYQYGFTEAAGNFQVDNFGRGGTGGDDVRAEAQDNDDGGANCNANFFTPADGSRPRMQMFQCDNTTPERDGDLDAGVIAHEYGHGISNRLTGGPSNASCLENDEQMGEGWSDWFLLSLTQRPTHDATTGRGVATYLFGQAPGGGGIRDRPYSTDFGVNEFTYDQIKSTGTSPHRLGHVWATMLWDLNWALIGDLFPEEGGASGAGFGPGFDSDLYDGTGGNNLAQQLIMDGMKLQPCSPGFIDGRDAILSADLILTGGANERVIWKVFARRGLGWSADQGDTDDRTDGTEAFDMPPHLNRPPTADAGEDQTGTEANECASPAGTEVTLDGTGSSDPDENDPDGDVITFEWTGPFPEGGGTVTGAEPTVTLEKGEHTITLTVTDEHGATDTDEVVIAIEDTEPPTISLLGDNPVVLECALEDYEDPGATATDQCDGDLTSEIVVSGVSDVDPDTPGTYLVTYNVDDDAENSAEEVTREVKVQDTTAPVIDVITEPIVLWPPNHKYHTIRLTKGKNKLVLDASDACNTSLSKKDVVITEVTSDEPDDNDGDGSTINDIVIAEGCQAADLRAERDGDLNGRVYTTHLGVDDGFNVGTASPVIHVPLDMDTPVVADSPMLTEAGCTPVAPSGAAITATEGDDGADSAGELVEMDSANDRGGTIESLPSEYRLDQSYPNPFNRSTQIQFALPEEAHVQLAVYDVVGREVARLIDRPLPVGIHTARFDVGTLPSGTYLYRMEAGTFTATRRMVLVK